MKKEVTMIICDRCGYSSPEERAKDWTSLDGFDMCPYCTRSYKEFEKDILKWKKTGIPTITDVEKHSDQIPYGLVGLKKILIDGHSIGITLEKYINKEDALDDSGRSGAD